MTARRFIGIDPGPIPGLVLLDYENTWLERAEAMQCSAGFLTQLLEGVLLGESVPTLVQVEKYVVGNRSARSSTPRAGAQTRDLVGQIQRTVIATTSILRVEAGLVERPATAVKPWATDARLDAAGLLADTKGMRHARDAARHALFVAVKAGMPDPLSKEFTR